ncbi:hypothetical protein CBR_g40521 [Chara braunii]|uniref:Uncharacterized protein n=1 Tax=Chara braunii TaxID=69332 RepID=A0A388K1Z1_CHABU|nr:hypothetical protein CBR_g40521 [Chara braunii]|eukprot:GBG64074.1 hypothetical protein CBR_g40521 [Chara braunii]
MGLEGGWRSTKQWGASQVMKVATPRGHPMERVSPGRGEANGLSMPNGPSVERGMSPAGWPADELSMSGRGPGDYIQDEEGPAPAEGGDAEVAGGGAEDWRVNCPALGQLVCWCPNWATTKTSTLCLKVELEGTSEEVGEGHGGLVDKGGRQVCAANALNARDESKIVDDVKGDLLTKRADVLYKMVGWSGLLEPTELVVIVVDRFLWAEGGGDEGGPLKEGVRSETGVMAIRHFGVPPTSSVVHKLAASDGEPVDDGDAVEREGLLEFGDKEEDILMGLAREGVVVLGKGGGGATMVEVVVDEGGGVQVDGVGVEVEAKACPKEGVGWGVVQRGEVVVTTVMAGEFPSSVVTRSEMAAMVLLIVAREDLRAVNVWRIVASSRAVLLTESERRSDMLMEDWAMVGEEGVDDVAGAEVEAVAADVVAAAVAVATASAAAAASAAVRSEVLVGVVACGDGGDNFYLQEQSVIK